MRRIAYLIVLVAALMLAATPGTSMARRHHVHRARARTRVVTRTRTVYTAPREHGVNANGNVGVGLGPIHVGVGAGAGVNTHVYPTPYQDIPMLDQRSDSKASSRPYSAATVPISMNSTSALSTSAPVLSSPTAADGPVFISEDTNANNYYYTYAPPKVVTIGGFSTAVSGNPMYFSLFKHRTGPLPMHNHKGEDVTAGYGESPRAGSYGESIGGMAYGAAPLPQEVQPPIVEAMPTH